MTQARIEELRRMAAKIGAEQTRYHQFFRPYSAELERSFGEFMGDTTCVARSNRSGPFDFEKGSYFESGLGFDEEGWYCVPIMVRVNNLQDSGYDCLRIVARFSLEANSLTMSLAPGENRKFSASNLNEPCEYLFDALKKCFSREEYFNNPRNYQTTRFGFLPARS